MKEWFTPSEIAGLPGMPKDRRNVRIVADRKKFEARERAAGKGVEYFIGSLPAETQAALLARDGSIAAAPPACKAETKAGDPEAAAPFTYDRELLWQHFDRVSDALKEVGKQRAALLLQWERLVANGVKVREAFQAVGQTSGTPWRTIEGWYQTAPGVRRYRRDDWVAALVPGYTGRVATAECSEEAWEYFKADYLRLERPAATACYRRLGRAAADKGWTVPSLVTLTRKVVRDVPFTVRTLLRDGEEALMKHYPPQERSVRSLSAMEWINGDGYEHNVFVSWPDGTTDRPRTWFWQDVYSRKILAWRVDQTEHSDLIRVALADVLEFGVPSHVTIDNTRAAANKWLTGGVPNRYRFTVREDDPLGIFPMLGTQVHWTSVHNGRGHGQAKPVERAFGIGGMGEVVDKHPAFAGAYTGADPTAKPENYRSRAVPLDRFMAVLTQEVIAWNARPGRRTEICRGELSFDQAFERSYSTAVIRKATEEQRRICLLTAEAIRIQRGGYFTLEAGKAVGIGRNRYEAPELRELPGEKVVVRFDPQDLHDDVYVYTLGGKFICAATCTDAQAFGATEPGRAHNRFRKQFMRATRLAAAAEVRMDAIEASRLLPVAAGPDVPDAKVVRPFRPLQAQTQVVRLTEAERAEYDAFAHEAAAATAPVQDVSVINDAPCERYAYWWRLDQRRDAGEQLSERDAEFYRSFPSTADFKVGRDMLAEFGEDPAQWLPEWAKEKRA